MNEFCKFCLGATLVKHGLLFNFEEDNNSTCPLLYKTKNYNTTTSHAPAREESNKYDLTGAPCF